MTSWRKELDIIVDTSENVIKLERKLDEYEAQIEHLFKKVNKLKNCYNCAKTYECHTREKICKDESLLFWVEH